MDDGHEERWDLTRTARAGGEARVHVDRHRDLLGDERWRRARLLASELATNAFRHGRGRIVLSISRAGTGMRFCVTDEGSERPEPRPPDLDGGYGLNLVASLSDRWGRSSAPTAVWFELDLEAPR